MRLQQLAVFWYLVLETNGMACLLAMRAFGAALLILGLVIVALSLPGILHVFAGGNRPPDNRSWAPAFVGVGCRQEDPRVAGRHGPGTSPPRRHHERAEVVGDRDRSDS